MLYIILAILAFGVLVFVHELGHFTLAKLNGVRVEEFSIGMGPKIFSKQGRETKYSIGILPIGGYVNMMGEEEAVEDERSFSSKSPLRRISIIIAGVFMNYVLAIIIFTACTYHAGAIRNINAAAVTNGSPAYESGILEGDKFVKVNGMKVFTQQDISVGVLLSKGNPIDVVVERDGQKKEVTVTPKANEDGQYVMGVSFAAITDIGIVDSFKYSFRETASLVSQTFKSLEMMITGKANFKTDVGGPVTIIKMSAATAKAGIWNLVYFVGYLSVNLAVFNLLPFPALDGGWTVILLIELITRRKVPDKFVGVLNYIGFAILIGLMVIVTIKDIIYPIF